MKRTSTPNQSVRRAIEILEYLADADGPRDLVVISQGLSLNKSTAFRFLTSLAAHGYVRQDPESSRYALGPRVLWLASRFLAKVQVRQVAHPLLEKLAHETGETAHLAVLDGDFVAYIDKIDGNQSVRMVSRIGSHTPVHSTALGKVLLSALPEEEWQTYVAEVGLARFTPNTLTDPVLFYKELRRVRAQGYAVDNVENEAGIRCLAAPIRDHTGCVIASSSISGWTLSMTPERVRRLIAPLKRTALEVSRRMGYEGDRREEK